MRKAAILIVFAIFFALFGYNVYQKEAIISDGTTMVLSLRPLDPRSLMQGDYMTLDLALAGDIQKVLISMQETQGSHLDAPGTVDFVSPLTGVGAAVVALNDQNEPTLIRIHIPGSPLQPGEHLLKFRQSSWHRVRISSGTFFFQESKAKRFEAARFAILQVSEDGTALITHLLDAKRKIIQ